ncbi:MAG: 4Fe-4S binding protein [Armatimonadota bacterium]
MKRALICPDQCQNCLPCDVAEKCRFNAVFRERPEDKPWIDFYKCTGCLECKRFCTHGAITDISKPCKGRTEVGW